MAVAILLGMVCALPFRAAAQTVEITPPATQRVVLLLSLIHI